jgi:hypothetical protein
LIDLVSKKKTGKIKGVVIPGTTEAKDVIFTLDASFNIGIQ